MAENIKDEVKKMAEKLDENAEWEDVMYAIYVRESIKKGKEDVHSGNIISHDDIKVKYNVK
jgi:predicted DNA-binding protein